MFDVVSPRVCIVKQNLHLLLKNVFGKSTNRENETLEENSKRYQVIMIFPMFFTFHSYLHTIVSFVKAFYYYNN